MRKEGGRGETGRRCRHHLQTRQAAFTVNPQPPTRDQSVVLGPDAEPLVAGDAECRVPPRTCPHSAFWPQGQRRAPGTALAASPVGRPELDLTLGAGGKETPDDSCRARSAARGTQQTAGTKVGPFVPPHDSLRDVPAPQPVPRLSPSPAAPSLAFFLRPPHSLGDPARLGGLGGTPPPQEACPGCLAQGG